MRHLKNRTDFLLVGLVRISLFYLFFWLLLFAARVFFVFYFGDSNILNEYRRDIFHAFYLGWRYDTLASSYFVLIPYLLLLVGSSLKSTKVFALFNWLLKTSFLIFAPLTLFTIISDLGFFSYFQDHINILFFGLFEDDTQALFETMWKNYPMVPALIGVGIYAVLVLQLRKLFFPPLNLRKSYVQKGLLKFIFLFFLSLGLFVGAIRGGYGKMVISPQYSDFSESEFINQVSLNGLVALEMAMRTRIQSNDSDYNMLAAMGFGNNIHQAFSTYLGVDVSPTPKNQLLNLMTRKTPYSKTLQSKKYHVVVFIMESFGGSWNKYQSKDFNFLGELKTHFDQGVYFPNIISADNGTIGSLLTVATGIPSRPGKRFLSESKFLTLPLSSSAQRPYQNYGYEASFIYGGKLGWRDIGRYFSTQGYDHIIGENKIKKELSLKGRVGTEWGVYDEHFFEYVYQKLKNAKHPQFFMGLSTSNHPPFEFPKSYKPFKLEIPPLLKSRISREKDLFLLRFQAFQYANQMLANFIARIKNSDLAENTIIAVTGDHNFWGFMNYERSEVFAKYTVPLYFYLPADFNTQNVDMSKVGSHEDIMGTLYNLSLSEAEYISFGEDLFANAPTYALNAGVMGSAGGVIYRDKEYTWAERPYIQTEAKAFDATPLRDRFRSTMAVVDYYLETMYKNFKVQ